MQMSRNRSPLKIWLGAELFPWALVIVGAAILLLALADALRKGASTDWPTAGGTVIGADLQAAAPAGRTPGEELPRRAAWRALVRYQYSVEGTRHTGVRVSLASAAPATRAEAEAVLRRYPPGTRVQVYYRPEHPTDSVLEPGLPGPPWLSLLLGGLFCLAGIGLIVFLPRIVRGGR